MLLRSSFLKHKRFGVRIFSSAAATEVPTPKIEDFRTRETDPTNHNASHIGRFYTMSPKVKEQLFTYGGFMKSFVTQCKSFTETCLMVREPAVEIINYIKNTDFSKPVNRYVLYGKMGTGRTQTLAHVIHYGFVNDFLLIHVPWVPNWFRRPKEKSNSLTKEGYIDINIDAASWLLQFKAQNATLLPKLDLKCSQDYTWSPREITPAGSPLLDVVEHGINRIKYASDAVSVLIEEIKKQSTEGKCKTMVAIDGYNAFFYPETLIKNDSKVLASPDKITITAPFLNITSHDWCNGVCILVVDERAISKTQRESYLPFYLLGREGFEYLDPFIPVEVKNYNDIEYQNCFDYFMNRKWIQINFPGIEKELKFLSNANPLQLTQVCAPL